MDKGISIGEGVLWVLAWFCVMLVYTFLDVAVWRKIAPGRAKLLNVISVALCMGGFLYLLRSRAHFQISLADGISPGGIVLAIGCAVVMYFLLDRCLDPVFEGLLPGSEDRYQQTLQDLSKAPVLSFVQVCILTFVRLVQLEKIRSGSFCIPSGIVISVRRGQS